MRIARLVVMAALLFAVGLIAPHTAAAQSAYVGSWDLVPDSLSGKIPGSYASPTVEIGVYGSDLILTQHPIVMQPAEETKEIYRLDGSESNLSGYRKGRLTLADSTLNLTTIRIRPGNDTVTIISTAYQASDNLLIVTRTLRVERPAGRVLDTPLNRWEARYTRR